MAKLPSFQFYPGDWLKDTNLRRCSHTAKGVWIDMLCLMFEADERGVLATNGVAWSDEEIACAIGGDSATTIGAIQELSLKGVVKRQKNGAAYSKRMVMDENKRRLCSEAGRRGGGNPKLTQKNETFKGVSKGPSKVCQSSETFKGAPQNTPNLTQNDETFKGTSKGGVKGSPKGVPKGRPKASTSSSTSYLEKEKVEKEKWLAMAKTEFGDIAPGTELADGTWETYGDFVAYRLGSSHKPTIDSVKQDMRNFKKCLDAGATEEFISAKLGEAISAGYRGWFFNEDTLKKIALEDGEKQKYPPSHVGICF